MLVLRLGEKANFMFFGLDSDASERDLDNARGARRFGKVFRVGSPVCFGWPSRCFAEVSQVGQANASRQKRRNGGGQEAAGALSCLACQLVFEGTPTSWWLCNILCPGFRG